MQSNAELNEKSYFDKVVITPFYESTKCLGCEHKFRLNPELEPFETRQVTCPKCNSDFLTGPIS